MYVQLILYIFISSIQQFVKGCGSFVTDMADAILTSLTNGRHAKFAEMIKKEEEKKKLPINKKMVSLMEKKYPYDWFVM